MIQKVQGKQPQLIAKNFRDLKKLAFITISFYKNTCAVVWDITNTKVDDKQKIQVFMPEWTKAFMPSCKVIYAC